MKFVTLPFILRVELWGLRAFFILASLWLVGKWLWKRCKRTATSAFQFTPWLVLCVIGVVQGKGIWAGTTALLQGWGQVACLVTSAAALWTLAGGWLKSNAAVFSTSRGGTAEAAYLEEMRNRIGVLEKALVGVSSTLEHRPRERASPKPNGVEEPRKKRPRDQAIEPTISKEKTRCLACGKTVAPDKHECWVLKREISCYKCNGKNHIAITCDDNKKKVTMSVSSSPDREALEADMKRMREQLEKLTVAMGEVIEAPAVMSFCNGEELNQQPRHQETRCSCP